MLLVGEAGGNKKQVADRAGSSPNYIYDLIKRSETATGNARSIGDDLAERLEKAFGKPAGWMDRDNSHAVADERGTYTPRDKAERELLETAHALTPENQRLLINIAKTMAAQTKK